MAKPIEPTPPLEGKDAKRFVKELVETNKKISPASVHKAREKAFSIKFNVE